jgi:hypothetical protein
VILSSLVSLSAVAQSAPVRDGSNASRAPLPSSRPAEYVRVIHYTSTGSQPHSALVAMHIGGPTANQLVAVAAPAAPQKRKIALAQRE